MTELEWLEIFSTNLRELIDKKKIDNSSIEYTQINAITGDSYKDRYLYYQLKLAITKAKSIDIIVSFLMENFNWRMGELCQLMQ